MFNDPFELVKIESFKDGIGCTEEEKIPTIRWAFFDHDYHKVWWRDEREPIPDRRLPDY